MGEERKLRMPDNWPDPGTKHLPMETDESTVLDENDDDDIGELADVELEYRGRGRPRKPADQRRREKLVISLTADELRQIMLRAASDQPIPLGANEWARRELLRLSVKKEG